MASGRLGTANLTAATNTSVYTDVLVAAVKFAVPSLPEAIFSSFNYVLSSSLLQVHH